MYRVVEIFDSIQSEGFYAGTPAVFIRMFGCNLQCDFGDGKKCDEPLHTQNSAVERMSTESIINRVRNSPRHVVITGGEPSIVDLNSLIIALQDEDKFVQIETNGLQYNNIRSANYITFSPKIAFDSGAPMMQGGFHELKLLAGPYNIPDVVKWLTVKRKYIQPIADGDKPNIRNIHWCHNWVVNNSTWKLSLQSHKWYGAE